jgi:hypothetical protein
MSTWDIDLGAIEKKIGRHPWVRRVFVRREFPRRIIIDVEERTPKAIVALRKLYYVDADGVVFKEVGPGENVKLPLLTGLRAEQFAAPDPATRKRIRDALRLSEMMVQRSHSLSEIHFAKPDRLVVYTTAYPIALHMGWGNWAEKEPPSEVPPDIRPPALVHRGVIIMKVEGITDFHPARAGKPVTEGA